MPLDAGGRVGVRLVERLALEQRLRQRVEPLAVCGQQPLGGVLLLVDYAADLRVYQLMGRLGDGLGAGE